LEQTVLALRIEGIEPTTATVKERLFPAESTTYNLLKGLKQFIAEHEKTHSEAFYTKYKTLSRELAELFAQETVPKLADLADSIFDQYVEYLKTVKQNAHNTLTKKVQFLKTYLYWAREKGYAPPELGRKWKVPAPRRVLHVALTENELHHLQALVLPDRLAKTRDVFCFGCYTGLRYSDIGQLGPEHLHFQDQTPVVQFTVIKTRQPLTVALNPRAYAIWQQYGGKLPVLSNQKTNTYLKELMQLAGFDSPTQVVQFRGGTRTTEIVPKHKRISTHTARRTFATLSAAKGMNLVVLSRILGHSNIQQTMTYIKDIDGTAEMLKVWG